MALTPLDTTDARALGRTIGEHLRDRPAAERLEFFVGLIGELEWLAREREIFRTAYVEISGLVGRRGDEAISLAEQVRRLLIEKEAN
jgi:hypothetical protein